MVSVRNVVVFAVLLATAVAAGYYVDPNSASPISVASAQAPPPIFRPGGGTEDGVDPIERPSVLFPPNAPVQSARPRETDKIARVGNESVTLHFKPQQARGVIGAFADDGRSFATLIEAAASDDDRAALQLWQALRFCKDVPLDPATHAKQLQSIRDSYARTVFGAGTSLSLEQNIAALQSRFDRCKDVTDAMYSEALDYLRAAADRGENVNTRVEYAWAISKDDPAEARRRYQELWSEGHLSGLRGLSVVGEDPLPYRIASDAEHLARLDGLPHDSRNYQYLQGHLQGLVDELRNATSPSAYDEATKKAAELLRAPACCFDP
jgi:hypothetical protein